MADDDAGESDLLPELTLFLELIDPDRGAALARYIGKRRNTRQRNLAALGDSVLEQVGSVENLFERINGDERLQWMLETAGAEAAHASTTQKARALGRALASGALAADDAQVDEAAQRLRIIADLEAVDVKVLDLLAKVTYYRTVEIADLQERPEPVPRSASAYVRISQLEPVIGGMSLEAFQAALAVLQRDGLVGYVVTMGTGSAWYVSELGIALLEDFAAAAELDSPDAEPPPGQ